MLKKIIPISALSVGLVFQGLMAIIAWTSHEIHAQSSICIVIPAYNEELRIEHTLRSYVHYFSAKPEDTTFLIVANNCKDDTVGVSKKIQAETAALKNNVHIEIMDLKPGGKGFALKEGFLWAISKDFTLIGFVDADMATKPQYFYDLIIATANADGAIASRYISGADVSPARPWLRKIGGKFYNWILRTKLHIPFKDTQCGAKIFSYDTIQKIAPHLQEQGWAIDLEMLYLCKLEGKVIKEIPTTWSDQPGSHLNISSKLIKEFLNSPERIKKRHRVHKKQMQQDARNKKKISRKNKQRKK